MAVCPCSPLAASLRMISPAWPFDWRKSTGIRAVGFAVLSGHAISQIGFVSCL